MAMSKTTRRRVKKTATLLFFTAVIVLLVLYASKLDWEEIGTLLRDYDRRALLGAGALVAVSYLLYGCYDLMARRWCHHKLAAPQVMLVSFICYAFNLTLSTWIGGIAMRYRLYSRLGLNNQTITRIFSLSIATNWIGYLFLGGILFASGQVVPPSHWYVSGSWLQASGIILLALVAAYLWGCAFARRRHVSLRGHRFELPDWKFAMLQIAVSSLNWMTMGTIIWLLLDYRVDYFFVLGVLLVSSIAGVIIHIPAGIGVLEAVFLALLAGQPVSRGMIIAALLAYRVLYFILPLLLALLGYLWLEGRAKSLRSRNQQKLSG